MLHLQRKLVSIIIPCFNAGRWVQEAIESCFAQTYPNLEIIVIDDGSTDNSLEAIKKYEGKLIWESGENRGGNYARNRGFALATGDYIQYLDADDYLLPDKIAKQVQFLETTGADIVYNDVQYQYHFSDCEAFREPACFTGVSGRQEDILASLITYGCLPPIAYLFRRSIIAESCGWDEKLKAGQDRDFLISLVMQGAKVAYQPGNESIYRRYGNVTVSTANKALLVTSFCIVLKKAETQLIATNKLSLKYLYALAKAYSVIAIKYKADIGSLLHRSLLIKSSILFTKFTLKKATIKSNRQAFNSVSVLN